MQRKICVINSSNRRWSSGGEWDLGREWFANIGECSRSNNF